MKKITRILAVLAALTTLTVSAVPAYAEETATAVQSDEQARFEDDTHKIFEYIEKEKLDADSYSYSDDDKNQYFMVEYLNDEAKAAVETFIRDNGISMYHIKFREMSKNDTVYSKAEFIAFRLYELIRFDLDKRLHFHVNCKTDENGDETVILNYYYTHEDEKPILEKFISDRGYDKYAKIGFKALSADGADPNEKITDPELMQVMIEDHITDNGLHADTCIADKFYDENEEPRICLIITVDDFWYDEDSGEPIKRFMKEKNIDESYVMMEYMETAKAVPGDANGDFTATIRDCARIAQALAQGKGDELPESADFNRDGSINIRDAAGLAKYLSENKAHYFD